MDEIPAEFFSWLEKFGTGRAGILALAMILLAFVVWRCLPPMWKAYLEYRVAMKEIAPKTRELDLQILDKVERMGGRAFRVRTGAKKPKKKGPRS